MTSFADELSDVRRLDSIKRCVLEWNANRGGDDPDRPRVCQMIRLWEVDIATRMAVPEQVTMTYACGHGEQFIDFITKSPRAPKAIAVVEVFQDSGSIQGRFLVKPVKSLPCIRGMYMVETKIISPVLSSPAGTIFHRDYFRE